MKSNISLEDLIVAYRKAKVDFYYEQGHLPTNSFADYERNLYNNLENLQYLINSGNYESIVKEEQITHSYLIKSIEFKNTKANDGHLFYSDHKRNPKYRNACSIKFRMIGRHSVDMHIISSLWIEKVGSHIEKIVRENSYGCRLKRRNQKADGFILNKDLDPDPLELGHFRPYIYDYKRWQNNGINAIEAELKKGNKVVAITSDINKFYHRIYPSFILDQDFVERYDIQYNDLQLRLNHIILELIELWNNSISDDDDETTEPHSKTHYGVPVGLSVSKVIANLLLAFFDDQICNELQPIYYGRYVDDIFIAIEDNGDINSSIELWDFIAKRIPQIKIENSIDPSFEIPYSTESRIEFGKEKEKIFILEDSSGDTFINTLREQIEENSSEWRMLPNSEEDIDSLAKDISTASSNSEDIVSGLRKSDGVSIQRFNFVLRLRNFETLVELLPKENWEKGLNDFFTLINDYVLTIDNIRTYQGYYPRLLSLAIRAGSIQIATSIYESIKRTWDILYDCCENQSNWSKLNQAREYQLEVLRYAVIKSLDPNRKEYSEDYISFFKLLKLTGNIHEKVKNVFLSDLHNFAFKDQFLINDFDKVFGNEEVDRLLLNYFDQNNNINSLLQIELRRKFVNVVLKKRNIKNIPSAFVFFTRPFSTIEISILQSNWENDLEAFKSYIRLFTNSSSINWLQIPRNKQTEDTITEIEITGENKNPDRVFALTSLLTKDESWEAVIKSKSKEPDKSRYKRLFGLINDILNCRTNQIDYVVFPELSIPRQLLIYIAQKFKAKGISIIAGIEYEHKSFPSELPISYNGAVSNQLVYLLNVNSNGFQHQVAIKQEKVFAAQIEEKELFNLGGKVLIANDTSKYLINHNGFFMSGLICNDLLNIDYRQILRGRTDSLIIIEWNKDVNTYDSLVAATANDLHCFVIQVNNRKYGDTRLRGPYKEAYERDRVRVRGGELDYFVLTTLEVKKLRKFQDNHRSPSEPFKPVPTGFKMAENRKLK